MFGLEKKDTFLCVCGVGTLRTIEQLFVQDTTQDWFLYLKSLMHVVSSTLYTPYPVFFLLCKGAWFCP